VQGAADENKDASNDCTGNKAVIFIGHDYKGEESDDAWDESVGQDLYKDQAYMDLLSRYLVVHCAASTAAGLCKFPPGEWTLVFFDQIEGVSLGIQDGALALFTVFVVVSTLTCVIVLKFYNSLLHF